MAEVLFFFFFFLFLKRTVTNARSLETQTKAWFITYLMCSRTKLLCAGRSELCRVDSSCQKNPQNSSVISFFTFGKEPARVFKNVTATPELFISNASWLVGVTNISCFIVIYRK